MKEQSEILIFPEHPKMPDIFYKQVNSLAQRPATQALFLHTYIGDHVTEPEETKGQRSRQLLDAAMEELDLPYTRDASQMLLAIIDRAVVTCRSAYRALHPSSDDGVPTSWTTIDQLYQRDTPQLPVNNNE